MQVYNVALLCHKYTTSVLNCYFWEIVKLLNIKRTFSMQVFASGENVLTLGVCSQMTILFAFLDKEVFVKWTSSLNVLIAPVLNHCLCCSWDCDFVCVPGWWWHQHPSGLESITDIHFSVLTDTLGESTSLILTSHHWCWPTHQWHSQHNVLWACRSAICRVQHLNATNHKITCILVLLHL